MGKKQLLFVTYRDEKMEEGLAYAMKHAKAMSEDVIFLLVQKKIKMSDNFWTVMSAIAFAEAGEQRTAHKILSGSASVATKGRIQNILSAIKENCFKEGIRMTVHETDMNAVSGIKAYLKKHAVSNVILSPAITEKEHITAGNFNGFVEVSRPAVTMTMQAAVCN